jgi:hypothetical protein
MKIIYTNSITGVSSSATQLSSDYAIAKVENNYPKQPYIADAATATITVTCPGAEAIFFSYLAESVTVTFKDSGASTLSTETTRTPTHSASNTCSMRKPIGMIRFLSLVQRQQTRLRLL